MAFTEYKRLNFTLSDGLICTRVKLSPGSPLAICYITDLEENVKIVLDLAEKKIVSSPIEIADKDVKGLWEAIHA